MDTKSEKLRKKQEYLHLKRLEELTRQKKNHAKLMFAWFCGFCKRGKVISWRTAVRGELP